MAQISGDVTFLFIIFFIERGFIFLQTEKRMMSGLYAIPLAGLREGRYTYDFAIGDDFFEEFDATEVHRGDLKAEVILDKRSSHLELTINVSGTAEVMCDRCLEMFRIPVSCTNRLFVRQGKEWEETDPDMITMSPEEHEIDLRQFFYEYIHLALPLQRVHPADKQGNTTCDPEMIKKMEDYLIRNDSGSDPRWDDLKKLKDDSKN